MTSPLKTLEDKYREIKDLVFLCAKGHSNGAYIWGDPGIGKSYAAIQQLEVMDHPYELRNTRLSAPGLFKDFKRSPTGLFLIEDIESTMTDKPTLDLLRGALWGQPDKFGKQIRKVNYTLCNVSRECIFEGQVVFTGNKPLADCPVVNAVATRILQINLVVDYEEIEALMKKIVSKDYVTDKGTLNKKLCSQVLDIILEETPIQKSLDIRILIKMMDAVLGLQSEDVNQPTSFSNWKDFVRRQMRQESKAVGKAAVMKDDFNIAVALAKKELSTDETLKEWTRLTGKRSLRMYYEHLNKLK